MKRKPSPAVAISLVALFFSLTATNAAGWPWSPSWRPPPLHPIRNAVRTYITTPMSQQRHIGRCHRLHRHEHVCAVSFVDFDSITINGQPVATVFDGDVFVRRAVGGLRCTYDPIAFAWERC